MRVEGPNFLNEGTSALLSLALDLSGIRVIRAGISVEYLTGGLAFREVKEEEKSAIKHL